MKANRKKQEILTSEEMMEQMQKLFEEKGSEALNVARKLVLEEKIECKEIKEALRYFMTEYWNDLARPTLLSLVCEAVGGDPKLTNSVAVPMILISGAIDIHDDIIDESKIKQKRLTVFGKFGRNIALLVGDALMFKSLVSLNHLLENISNNKRRAILETIRKMFFQLGDAEALELQFRGRVDVAPKDYIDVVRKKAADVEAHTRISAIIGNGTENEINALGRYGRLLGMLIILQDDLRDIFDFEEFSHRVNKESLPLPVLYALQKPSFARSQIISMLQEKKMTKKDIQKLFDAVKKAGGLSRLQKLIKKIMNDARISLQILGRKQIRQLLQLITFFAPTDEVV